MEMDVSWYRYLLVVLSATSHRTQTQTIYALVEFSAKCSRHFAREHFLLNSLVDDTIDGVGLSSIYCYKA